MQVRTAVSRTLVSLFETDMLDELLEDVPAQMIAYNRSVLLSMNDARDTI